MKRLFLIFGLLWSALASAQFTPGQLLTAQELNSQFALYAPLAGATYTGSVTVPTLTVTGTFTLPASTVLPNGVTATEQGYLDNSSLVATNSFVKRSILAATGTIPIANVTGGIYNFQTTGSGAQIVVLASGGAITGVLTIAVPGTTYQVGDCLLMVGGNGDAILRVTSLSGSGVAGASVVYGGTGYTTGAQLAGMPLPPGSRDGVISGTLTSNLTIIIPAGTYLQGSRRIVFNNNTTGAFTTTIKLSNGSGGSTGTGVVLPQGTNNSASAILYTDGQNDVWLADSPLGIGAVSTGSVTNCSGTSSALNFTTGSGFSCNATINALTLGGATFAAPGPIGSTSTSSGAFSSISTPSATIGGGTINGTSVGATSPSTGAFTTLSSTGATSLTGVTGGTCAGAGLIGQCINSNIPSGSAVALTTAVVGNVTSVSLTAGNWLCYGNLAFSPAGTTVTSSQGGWISTASATNPTPPNAGSEFFSQAMNTVAGTNGNIWPVGFTMENLTTTTTVFLEALANFTTSTESVYGYINCIRWH
jgi:hypothetical protein